MKRLHLAALLFNCLLLIATPASAETLLISFLKQNFTSDQSPLSETVIMNKLINDDAKEWVNSISPYNLMIQKNTSTSYYSGFKFEPALNRNDVDSAYIKISFNPECLMKATKITLYTSIAIQTDPTPDVFVQINGKEIEMDGNISYNTYQKSSASTLLSSINKSIQNNTYNQYAWSSYKLDEIPLENLKIQDNYDGNNTKKSPWSPIQLFAIAVEYTGTVSANDLRTAIHEIDDAEACIPTFYDMLGNRLPSAPQQGLYIRKTGNRVEKLIGNGKVQF